MESSSTHLFLIATQEILLACSVLVIVGVDALKENSSLAAAIATAPTGTPLSIWLIIQQTHPSKKDQVRAVHKSCSFALCSHIDGRG